MRLEIVKLRNGEHDSMPLGGEDRFLLPTRKRVPNAHELAGLAKWQWPQQHAVDDAVNRRCRADAESDGRDRHGGEHGTPAKRAHGEAEVLGGEMHQTRSDGWPRLDRKHGPKVEKAFLCTGGAV